MRPTFFHLKCLKSATLDGFSIVSEVLVLKYKGNFSLSENCGDDVLYPIWEKNKFKIISGLLMHILNTTQDPILFNHLSSIYEERLIWN